MWYQQWSEPLFYPNQLPQAAAVGAAPLISWDPILNGAGIPLTRIVAGGFDDYIRAAARGATAWPHQIYIRFAHEMNLPSAPFGPGHSGNTPALFIAAWRHVVTIFRQEGASNVKWVWSPNIDCNSNCPFQGFFPGDKWVDWVALDGYNYAALNGVPWLTFAQIFGRSYATLARLSQKPMMIGETSSVEAGGDKAAWIRDMGTALRSDFLRIKALVWFQRVKETDWRVESSAASLASFRALVASRLFAR